MRFSNAAALGVTLMVPSAAFAQTLTVGTNVHVSRAHPNRAHYEIHLAADPSRADRLVGGSMIWTPATNRYSVGAYTSRDGGASWAPTLEVDLGAYAADPA